MKLDPKRIETLSVNAVRDSIVMSDYLDQYIPDNDKEPFWDGSVYIYKKKDHTKENFRGRMAVQVKGKECSDFSKTEISYKTNVVDLEGYLKDGGVVYFVVYIGNQGLIRKIYYAELTPIKLRIILEEAKGQKSKKIKLKEFPSDGNKKSTIFFNCLQNCEKQSSFSYAKLFSLEDLKKQGNLESITIPLSGIKIDEDPQSALIDNEVYLYANVKGSAIPQPIEMILKDLCTREERNVSISIDGKEFYSHISIVKSAQSVKYIIGKSLTLTTTEKNEPVKIYYSNADRLSDLVRDLDFMLSYIEKGYFQIGDQKFPFDYDGADFSKFNCDEQREILVTAQRLLEVLNLIGCKKELLISSLNDVDYRNIQRLIDSFLDGKSVKGLREGIPPISMLKLGNLHLILSLLPEKSKKGMYEIKDYFKTEMLATYKGRNGEEKQISQYAFLNADDIIKADNVQCDAFLPSFQKAEKHEETFERATLFLLNLLKAYDKKKDKEILNTAKEFAEWITSSSDEEYSYNLKTLNYYQVIKRVRALRREEKKTLYKIADDKGASIMERVGAYLLLDQQILAEMCFEELDAEGKEMIKNFPIYHFWNESDCKDGE